MMIVTLRRRKRVLANRTKMITLLLVIKTTTTLTPTFFFFRNRPPAGFLSPHCYPLRQDRCWPLHITYSFELKWSHLVSNIQDSGQWLRVGGHLRGKCWFYISFDLIFPPQQKIEAAPISLMILALFCEHRSGWWWWWCCWCGWQGWQSIEWKVETLQFSNVGPAASSAPGCALIIPGLPKTRSLILSYTSTSLVGSFSFISNNISLGPHSLPSGLS